MKYCFISDCHLSAKRPAVIDYFINYIGELHHSTDELFILGDLFDIWTGNYDQHKEYQHCISALKALSQKIPIFYIHGNRDFLIGRSFAMESECQILVDGCVKKLGSQPTLLMHGDLLCTLDVTYQRYRKVVRHPLFTRASKVIPCSIRRSIGKKIAQTSHRMVQQKEENIMDVNPTAVIEYMLEHNVTRLIHGHTHRPAIHRFELNGRAMERIVLGDWYTQGSVLEMEDDEVNLRTLDI